MKLDVLCLTQERGSLPLKIPTCLRRVGVMSWQLEDISVSSLQLLVCVAQSQALPLLHLGVLQVPRDANRTLRLKLFFFFFSRATPVAGGGSQARSQIGAVAASLRHSHSNMGMELRLRPTRQLTATPDP